MSPKPSPGGRGPRIDALRNCDVENLMWRVLPVLCKHLRVRESEVIDGAGGREHARVRHVLWYILSRRFTRYAVSLACDVHHTTLYKAIRRIENEVKEGGDLARIVEAVNETLHPRSDDERTDP